MKYEEWLNTWLEEFIKPTLKYRTYMKYKEMVQLHIGARLGGYELNELELPVLQRFVMEERFGGNMRTNGQLAAATVNGLITLVQNSLRDAQRSGYLKTYTADKIKRPRQFEKPVESFSRTEQKQIETAVFADNRPKMFGVVLCLYTGLRVGELLALEWSDVDLIRGTMSITKSCYYGKNTEGEWGRIVGTPKTESSRREIPLPKQITMYLREYKRNSDKGVPYLISEHGKPISVRSYQRSFELLLEKKKIAHHGFHALRHTFATRALESGMDIKTLSELLGHRNTAVTLNRYVHSMATHKREMMNKVGKLLQ